MCGSLKFRQRWDITAVGKKVKFLDAAILRDSEIEEKELEKIMKYKEVEIEVLCLWGKKRQQSQ